MGHFLTFVFYTDCGIPDRFAGYTIGPVILIRPKYRGDRGLLEHERTHVRQWWRSFGLLSILYSLSWRYRLRAEIEAYCVQLRWSPGNEWRFARFIAEKYGIPISIGDAHDRLMVCR